MAELQTLYDEMPPDERKPGIYVHIPFCASKCGYCDFYSITDRSEQRNFIDALLLELELYASAAVSYDFDTIYFGGGTPSILSPDELERILTSISRFYNILQTSEITIEVNPGTVNFKQLCSYREAGFDRISIGMQSFSYSELLRLQRTHNTTDNARTFDNARRAGFENINIDLIYAIPFQSPKSWLKSLFRAVDLQPEHISAYNLTIEEGTPFHKMLNSDRLSMHDDKTEADFYSQTTEILNRSGFIQYEVSNFARHEQFISKHNSKYWDHTPYLAFGPSAHSFWQGRRYANVRSVHKYICKLNRSVLPLEFSEKVHSASLMFEHIFLRLRTRTGLNLQNFYNQFNKKFTDIYAEVIEQLIVKRLACLKNETFCLTQQGLILSDEILPLFVPNKF